MLQEIEFQNKSGNTKKGDSDYHVEPNGQIIMIKKPVPDRFPKTFTSPIQIEVSNEYRVLQESDFNKELKEKKAKGLIKEISLGAIQQDLEASIKQNLRERSVN